MLKCSRCRRLFPAPASPSQKTSPARPTAVPRTPESLTLPFEEREWKDEVEAPRDDDIELIEPEEQFTLGTETPRDQLVAPAVADEPPERPGAFDESLPPELPATARSKASRKDVARGRDAEDDAEAEGRTADRNRERGKVRAIFVFLALVVAGYAVVARALFASPSLCDRLLSRVPLIGRLGDDRLLTRKVALSDVLGNYQRIKDGKEVFVITGKAMNTSSAGLHGVQIAGRLYDRAGNAVDEKTIYCGNVISAKVLKDLTPSELSILQKLNPPRRFMIEPGESSTFVIVFMDPPRNVVEFSANVVAAQRQA